MASARGVWGAALAAGVVSTSLIGIGVRAQGVTAPPPLPPGITTEQLAPLPGVPGQPLGAPPGLPRQGPPGAAGPSVIYPGAAAPGASGAPAVVPAIVAPPGAAPPG